MSTEDNDQIYEEKVIKKEDEEKFLKEGFLEDGFLKIVNDKQSSGLSFSEIIEYIRKGKIPLQVTGDYGTKILDDEHFSEIQRVIPFLLKIIDKPRSFIRSLEEKVPVEIAKKLNYKAIAKLSRDNNDWYARTLLTVKPKNVVADVNEETIDLYENRFICALTDRIAQEVAIRRQYYQREADNISNNKVTMAMYNYTTNSFPFFNEIIRNSKTDNYTINTSYGDKIVEELKAIQSVENKIQIIKRSDFYRTLHRKRKVTDPIQKTNILMFEFNYNQAYKLWKYLNQNQKEEKLENQVDITDDERKGLYMLYCLIFTFATLQDMGFAEEISEESLNKKTYKSKSTSKKDQNKKLVCYSENKVNINGEMYFRHSVSDKIIKLWLENDEIHLSYKFAKDKWDEFALCPDFINFESMKSYEVSDYTKNLLDELADSDINKYAMVSVNLNRCSEQNTFLPKVYRRFFGIGNNYSMDESQEDLKKWADYKAGMIIITPVELKDNLRKLEKIINYHLLRHTDLHTKPKVCPLCGGINFTARGQDYICYDCKHTISLTYCQKCGTQHPIIWVKYHDNNFLKNEEVVNGEFADEPIYYQMSKIELIMGEKATTSFELLKENNEWKLKTICPRCGRILGNI